MTVQSYGGYEVELSHTDKPFFPDAGITKGDLLAYHERIADIMIPHIEERPLTLNRFPDGIGEDGFFQQARGDYFPDWLDTLAVDHGGSIGRVQHVLANRQASLVYLVNQGTVTFHSWLSTASHLKAPDQVIFDLDPPGDDFEPVRQAARLVAEGMRQCGLTPFVKTTGSRGLHVVAPLKPEAGFDRVRSLSQELAQALADAYPEQLTTEQRKHKRRGRLYLDIMRNAFGQTAVAPYSVRAKPEAPIATPLEWDELDDQKLGPQRFTLANIFRRMAQREDPWRNMQQKAVSIQTFQEGISDLKGGDL
ncbi:non-homologous end-joining DNA ligase [Marinobacter orientalis]|uniref:ATP-dependent DNA ligase n=1 Tax=Marinobacter orientalis TaxID=1928859 RepID=A0A7Y0WS71_9GAMM|nr:non-homologous end-joining DNA ligase [Marinobacter orientalis]NMT63537.1 ATP-dependent DNA ligase [Marinobacter orientalis]TGX48593.1 ATP-dependent DNA ligase [Marinobacter orientalis]